MPEDEKNMYGAAQAPSVIFLAVAGLATSGPAYAVVRPMRCARQGETGAVAASTLRASHFSHTPQPSHGSHDSHDSHGCHGSRKSHGTQGETGVFAVADFGRRSRRASLASLDSHASHGPRVSRTASVDSLGACRRGKAVMTGLATEMGGRIEWAERLRLPAAEAVLVSICCGGEVLGSAVVEVGEVARCGARGVKSVVLLSPSEKRKKGGKRATTGTLEVYGEDQIGAICTSKLASVDEGRRYILGLSADYLERRTKVRRHAIDTVYYTVHVACDDEGSRSVSGSDGGSSGPRRCANGGADDASKWACVFRSKAVERVRPKRAGGTTDVVYSTSLPLLSLPGTLKPVTGTPSAGFSGIQRLGRALSLVPDRSHVFSMPSASFAASSPSQEVKVSVFEARKGRDKMLAHAVFTMDEMAQGQLGSATDFFAPKREARRVGVATLLQKSHGHKPEYFGLHAVLDCLV